MAFHRIVLFSLLSCTILFQINAYRLPLPYGTGFPAARKSVGSFWPWPKSKPKDKVSIAPLVNAINEALDTIKDLISSPETLKESMDQTERKAIRIVEREIWSDIERIFRSRMV